MSRATGFRILFRNRVILPNETKIHIPGVTAFSPACLGVEAELPFLFGEWKAPWGVGEHSRGLQELGDNTENPTPSCSPLLAGPDFA